MGLLSKTNPAATRESVIRSATILGLIAAIGYLVLCIWSPALQENFASRLPVFVVAAAFLGGLLEWQTPDLIPIEETVRDAEEEFNVHIPDQIRAGIESAGDLHEAILVELRKQDASKFDDAQFADTVWEQLRALLVKQLGVDIEEVEKSARCNYELQ